MICQSHFQIKPEIDIVRNRMLAFEVRVLFDFSNKGVYALLSASVLALEGGGNLINPDGSLVFIFFLFLIFVFILNKVLFKPIGRVLDERASLTEGTRADAKKTLNEYRARLEAYETGIRKARSESYIYLEQQRNSALVERRLTVSEAKRHAAAEIEEARKAVAAEAEKARATLENDAREIAEKISVVVLGRTAGGRM